MTNKMSSIFKPTWKLFTLSIIIYIVNIIIILSIIPVLESQTLEAKIINLIVLLPNFFFEDLLGISSVKSIDILTWILLFVYDYILATIIIYFVGEIRK